MHGLRGRFVPAFRGAMRSAAATANRRDRRAFPAGGAAIVAYRLFMCTQRARGMARCPGCLLVIAMRRVPLPLLFFLCVAIWASAASPTQVLASRADDPAVDVRVERHGDALVIAASAALAADPATAWAVLTDYARYRNFIPGIDASRVVARRGTAVVVEQSDEVALWFLHMPVRVVYQIDEFPPARLQSRASAPSLPPLSSTFLIVRTDAGVRLEYVGYVGPGLPLLGRLEQPALQRAAVRDFKALAHEIERSGASTRNTDRARPDPAAGHD
jgi:hypothetical protein